MQNMLKSKSFWIASILAAGVIFVVGINLNKGYKSEVKILFVPKSEMAATNIKRIILDTEEIFNLEKKAGIEIETNKKSDIASVFAKGASRLETEKRALSAARNIAIEMSRYYDIKKDLDIRIIAGPVTKQVADFLKWIWIGIVLGSAIGGLIWIIYFKFSEAKFKKFDFNIERVREVFQRIVADRPLESGRTATYTAAKRASAPDNLPIGEDFILPVKKSKASMEQPEPRHEATPEEVKERLNKLLRGEM